MATIKYPEQRPRFDVDCASMNAKLGRGWVPGGGWAPSRMLEFCASPLDPATIQKELTEEDEAQDTLHSGTEDIEIEW